MHVTTINTLFSPKTIRTETNKNRAANINEGQCRTQQVNISKGKQTYPSSPTQHIQHIIQPLTQTVTSGFHKVDWKSGK